ncbi:YIP3 like protein [Aspergillus parasiticus SU-1]|uniref:YIP3 like protein n=1 Tax=Aspergillus parasiticus (strain ATCC 56775 / NRRL 5862 / SRRC 143 / SU-1) TaxID=1403190 RepID=A0A0F0ICM2_ASPPU|nr:YIP3 like protein [Aspergillus parasiticus SU-1]
MSPIQIPVDAITSRFGERFNSLRSQSLGSRFANLRPISEFLDVKRVSKPANFGEVQSRVNYNLSYFSSNYAAVFVMLSIYSLLTNFMLLFVIILVTGGLYGIGKLQGRDLDLGFARFNTSQLYTGLLIVAVPLGFLASPISTVLWLIGATGVGGGLGGRPRTPYGMPQWGRPPGAQRGRQTGRRADPWVEGDLRIEEINSEDEYLLRDNRDFYAKQLTGMDMDEILGRRKRMFEYDKFSDETGFVDGMDYSLHEDGDSTVAYAVQLALKDKEEWHVEHALERIRRAQMLGHKNVRLSKRELEALERKRMQTGGKRDPRRRKPTTKGSRSRDSSTSDVQRRGSSISQGGQTTPYRLACSSWAYSSDAPSRQSQPPVPSPKSSFGYSERHSTRPPQASLRGTASAYPLPDDPGWVPPYQLPSSRDRHLHARRSSVDPLQGASRRPSSYMSTYQAVASPSVRGSFTPRKTPLRSTVEGSHDDDDEESDSDDNDRVHTVDVVGRKVPTGRTAIGRGSRQRRRRS